MADPVRRAQLQLMKLSALVRDSGAEVTDVSTADLPAAMAGDQAWVLIEGEGRSLGHAVAWAARSRATSLQVVVDGNGAGAAARQAAYFRLPITVWTLHGRQLEAATPEHLPSPPLPTPAHLALVPTIEAGGAEPVVEHGVVAGEVNGLEVCRVVDDPETGETRLEVGIGAHDREAFQLLHGNRPTVEALADVVSAVAVHRVADAPLHPLNHLAQERMLRATVSADPAVIGADAVMAAQPPVPRTNLKDVVPCVALATFDGVETAVVCTSGVDLTVVPFAADARVALGVEDAVVVMPDRDLLAVQRLVAAQLVRPVRFVAIGDRPATP